MNREYYTRKRLNGHSLLFWAIEWFKLTNDEFFYEYGFNFNPHDYPGLYAIARKEVYGE